MCIPAPGLTARAVEAAHAVASVLPGASAQGRTAGSALGRTAGSALAPVCEDERMFATLHTNHGDIRLELFPDHAPKTVDNFVGLSEGTREFTDPESGEKVSRPFYDGVVFHRVISGFMIQGGDPLGTGTGGPGYNFDDEISEKNFNEPYVLAMANAGKRMNAITGRPSGTNGSQFFITLGPTPHLQGKHTVFGQVDDEESKKVVDTIGSAKTDMRDRPLEDVVIQSVTIEK